jgi:hypothetical protein
MSASVVLADPCTEQDLSSSKVTPEEGCSLDNDPKITHANQVEQLTMVAVNAASCSAGTQDDASLRTKVSHKRKSTSQVDQDAVLCSSPRKESAFLATTGRKCPHAPKKPARPNTVEVMVRRRK